MATTPKYNEILKIINSPAYHNNPEISIAFLSNITLDTVVNYLRYFSYTSELTANIYQGQYDNVLQEVMNSESPLYKNKPQVIIIALKKELLTEKLTAAFIGLTEKEIEEERKRLLEYFNTILSFIRKNTEAMVLLHNFQVPLYPVMGIMDYQKKYGQINTIRRFNLSLLDMASKYRGVYIIDTDRLGQITGYSEFTDSRYWHLARAPYTRKASEVMALEYMKFIKALKGKSKKCLVLDCDNTLWKGTLGEEGFNKIGIGKTYPGSLYRDFQKSVLEFYKRGIMLAICSKNNSEDVMEVLEEHPDMILRKEHFLCFKINWKDKVQNIKEIAEELNIGYDSIVFIDDSPFEVNMIRKLLPSVTSIEFPSSSSDFGEILASSGLFDNLSFSDEDLKRNEMYKDEMKRREAALSEEFRNLKDYYKYLEMEVFIGNGVDFTIPRISQMTQRTNQFNLTLRRYSESEIKNLYEERSSSVRYLKLKDRFGDMGIVGAAILKYEGRICYIDTFLLSCRAIGRGVEDLLLNDCAVLAGKNNCKELRGIYICAEKNSQVKDFYSKKGFIFLESKKEKAVYTFDPVNNILDVPKYFKSVQIAD